MTPDSQPPKAANDTKNAEQQFSGFTTMAIIAALILGSCALGRWVLPNGHSEQPFDATKYFIGY